LAAYKGAALLGPRTNAKTPDFATPVPLPPNLPGMEAVVMRVESLPPDAPVPLVNGGAFTGWREKLEGGAVVVEMTEDGFPAVVRAGGLHYLAGWADDTALDRILSGLCAAQGIAVQPMPVGLRTRATATHRYWFNYNPEAVEVDGVTVPAAGVHWRAL
jgi:beta-galactosidase